ncbi:DEAD-box ATP-dependent RNA helicase [Aliarcobacter faecis]|uniref:ATP-dependent RNA helicase DbpA n=1 Tax=Aliarcobacter faecis TaxID=1564138 RepID=UPI000478C87B|nr:ATP-dependent RNA helicase DbpA [Aliarcobacter faecis]QKF72924.1 DEAD-box ATP-dependent RNA helicase [Aliarcobacter faecis]
MKFSQLNISKEFIKNLENQGFIDLTPIQELSLNSSLEGKDLIARAKTGSGKTVAFSLPIVEKLRAKEFKVQALLLAPTRELANQIAQNLRLLFRHIHNVKILTLCGGVPFKPQVVSLNHQAHIIVGTPGRVLKHLDEKNLNLDFVETFVLDEADKMLDMGFFDDIEKVSKFLPKNRQTMLFSATYTEDIKLLASNILNDPLFIEVENEEKNIIKQDFYALEDSQKAQNIKKLIRSFEAKSTIIFCNQKITCEKLADILFEDGLDVLTMHSDLEQKQRDETLVLFSNQTYPILIASDVASRGLDIDDVDLVINYDLALNSKIHTHRIGRTARAGKGGVSISFYTNNEQNRALEFKEIFSDIEFKELKDIRDNPNFEIDLGLRAIFINGGKKHKIRKVDILGALTAGIGLHKDDIGKIDVLDFCSYVAVNKEKLDTILNKLNKTKIKGKYYNIYEK